MKKQSTNNSPNIKSNNKIVNSKSSSHYKYTEADLGEDILHISVCSIYPAVKRLVNNIYSRSYVFQS
ncbi:MAG: hypothetical protein ABIN36_18565 [Ferruginibacter sp.]